LRQLPATGRDAHPLLIIYKLKKKSLYKNVSGDKKKKVTKKTLLKIDGADSFPQNNSVNK